MDINFNNSSDNIIFKNESVDVTFEVRRENNEITIGTTNVDFSSNDNVITFITANTGHWIEFEITQIYRNDIQFVINQARPVNFDINYGLSLNGAPIDYLIGIEEGDNITIDDTDPHRPIISAFMAWGDITGIINQQTDLYTALTNIDGGFFIN